MLFKGIALGAAGSGKTSLLEGAANAGYNILLLDFDHCTEPLFAYTAPEFHKNITVVPYDEPGSIERLLRFIDRAKELDGKTIIALDGLTEMIPGAEAYAESQTNNPDARLMAWNAGRTMENVCRRLKRLPCHILVIAHPKLFAPHVESGYINSSGQYKGQDTALQRQIKIERARLEETAYYPNVPAESVARNFVHIFPFSLLTEIDESLKHASKRIVRTAPITGYQLKCPIAGIADKLPIETALTTILERLS